MASCLALRHAVIIVSNRKIPETRMLTRSASLSHNSLLVDIDENSTLPTAEFWRDSAIAHAESRRACNSRACYKSHSHPTFSIGAVDRGGSVFTGPSGVPYALRPGMMVFIPAGCVHACNPLAARSWSYQMLHLDAIWLRLLMTEMTDATDRLIGEREIRVIENEAVYQRFCQLNAMLFSASCAEEKDAALIEFIGHCSGDVALAGRFPAISPCENAMINKVIAALEQTERPLWTLAELADISGMSRYQLIRAIRAVTGMTPHVYQINVRITQARRLLQSGHSIIDISYQLGFADQSHFQRVFKDYTGVTPGCYRA